MIALQNYLSSTIIVIVSIALGIYLLFSMKNVYQQGWGKTILKFFAIQFAYTTLFGICILIVMLVSFLFF